MSMTRPPYPTGFREQMVELVRWGRSPEELAREFEPSAQSIRTPSPPVRPPNTPLQARNKMFVPIEAHEAAGAPPHRAPGRKRQHRRSV